MTVETHIIPRGKTNHTALSRKEVSGVIDHANASVIWAKLNAQTKGLILVGI